MRNTRLRDSYAGIWQEILLEAQNRGEFRSTISLSLVRLFILGALNWTVEMVQARRPSHRGCCP